MTAILNTVLIMGALAGGLLAVIHRCDWLGFCDSNVVPPAAADPAVATTTAITSVADPKDNGKAAKCGCCSCTQNSVKEIVCDTGAGSTTFSNSLSLADQCQACAADPKICKDAKKTKQQVDLTNKAINDAQSNAKKVSDPKKPLVCGPGFHTNSNGTCVPNGQTQKKDDSVKGNKDGTSPGCKSGEVYSNCHSVGGQLVCNCVKVHYARQSFYGVNPKPPVFRSHLSYF